MKIAFRCLCAVIIARLITLSISSAPFMRSDDDAVCSWHKNSGNKIALTFDDGPHPKYTTEILDILDEYGISATFFVVGTNAGEYPELIEREINSGHEIGNHTYTHADLKTSLRAEIINELSKTQEVIYEAREYRTRLLRPPEGKYSDELKRIAGKFDYRIVLWTVDTRDWAHTPSDEIYENVVTNVKSGDIILFHDFISGESPTPEALRMIIPKLLDDGFSFVTVSELIGSN